MDRRRFLKAAAAAAGAGAFAPLVACGGEKTTGPVATNALLRSRPRAVARTLQIGTTRQDIAGTSVVVELPASAAARTRVPTMLFLHGAGRTVETFLTGLRPLAATHGVMIVMPYATGQTWDAIRGDFGRDVTALDGVLSWLFDAVPVDPSRIALTGFSDGATYSIGLGRGNGDLFSRVVAYSPGFLLDVAPVGKPPIVISHGTEDAVLPYDNARYTIYPNLRSMGYDVDFRTFTGGHAVPLSVAGDQMSVLATGAA